MEGSDRNKEVESVMIAATPPSRGVKSRKRKRELEGLGSRSADAVSGKNLRETAPMVLARWKTAAYKGGSEPRKLAEGDGGLHKFRDGRGPQTPEGENEEGFDEWQTWEVDVGNEWISSEHHATGKQVTSDPLERSKTRNTARPWWMALETMKELEDCLKKLDRGVSR